MCDWRCLYDVILFGIIFVYYGYIYGIVWLYITYWYVKGQIHDVLTYDKTKNELN